MGDGKSVGLYSLGWSTISRPVAMRRRPWSSGRQLRRSRMMSRSTSPIQKNTNLFNAEAILAYSNTINTTSGSYRDENLHLQTRFKIREATFLITAHYGLSANASQRVHQDKEKRALARAGRIICSTGTTSPRT